MGFVNLPLCISELPLFAEAKIQNKSPDHLCISIPMGKEKGPNLDEMYKRLLKSTGVKAILHFTVPHSQFNILNARKKWQKRLFDPNKFYKSASIATT